MSKEYVAQLEATIQNLRRDNEILKEQLKYYKDLEQKYGCSVEELAKAFDLYINWTEECDFGYDNIPDEYEKYKNDPKFREALNRDYCEGLMYIAIQEAIKGEN